MSGNCHFRHLPNDRFGALTGIFVGLYAVVSMDREETARLKIVSETAFSQFLESDEFDNAFGRGPEDPIATYISLANLVEAVSHYGHLDSQASEEVAALMMERFTAASAATKVAAYLNAR